MSVSTTERSAMSAPPAPSPVRSAPAALQEVARLVEQRRRLHLERQRQAELTRLRELARHD